MTFRLSKNFHGVGIGPLSKILAVKVHTLESCWNTYLIKVRSNKYIYILIFIFSQELFASTSKLLFERLHNRFGRIHIQIPRSWSDDHCFSAGFIGKHQPSNSSKYDMIIGPYDKSETGKDRESLRLFAESKALMTCFDLTFFFILVKSLVQMTCSDFTIFFKLAKFAI